MVFLIQFAVELPTQNLSPNELSNSSIFFWILIIFSSALAISAVLFIIRSILRTSSKETKALDRTLLKIIVPKERKSEGQSGQIGQTDRLEQVKEEIAITETFFTAIGGLKAQSGFKNWLMGRDDHFSFEIIVHDGLIYFFIDTPIKMRQMIEQQIQAQSPHAEIEQIPDYNIFRENSVILGAYLISQNSATFPFKTYKTMDSDPMASILNTLSKINEHNSSAGIQFTIRSAHPNWRRSGIDLTRRVRKG